MKIPSWAVASAALLSVVLVAVGASAAEAAGSNDPTPYSVTAAGITLPAGDTFAQNGDVNVDYTVNGVTKGAGIHFDANNNQASGQYIGKSFLPWSAVFADTSYCITWVQLSEYNEHFGAGGQAPVCTAGVSTSTPSSTPSASSTPSSTPSASSTPSSTPSATSTPISSVAPTVSAPTTTPTSAATPTATSTNLPAAVLAPTVTPSPSATSVTKVAAPTVTQADVASPTVLASTGLNASTPIALAIAAAAILIGAAILLLRKRRAH